MIENRDSPFADRVLYRSRVRKLQRLAFPEKANIAFA